LSGVRGEPLMRGGGGQWQEDMRRSIDVPRTTTTAAVGASTPLFMPTPSRMGASPSPFGPPPAVRAEKPTGVYAQGAVYAGRALAEWSMVVSECNSFVDRRRDEGVLGLSEVEVPTLGVEGLAVRPKMM
jgi:hypothetical protein